MNILMIEVPTRERDGSVPFGLLYAASSVHRHGHKVKIVDLVKDDLNGKEVNDIIEDFSPSVVGMGGITSSYSRCKELIHHIKDNFKDVKIVVGGVITSVADLLILKAGVDYVVHGEGEITFPNLISAIENGEDASRIKGLSFCEHKEIRKTEDQPQITNLDDIPMPEYSLLEMNKYLEPAERWKDYYFKHDRSEYERISDQLSGKRYIFPIITARGCTHKCIFCYRHHRGLRQHSVQYVVSMIKYLHTHHGVDVFQINDELTTGNKSWMKEFCEALKREDMRICIVILSARVDTVDEEILTMLKEINCIMINYGYESGSNKILKEIRKGVTREQALKAGLLTKKAGIKNIPEIIIGFPSETEESVNDTIDFLKQLNTWPISVNTPIPFPETPLWQYAIDHNLIKDKEEFILGYKRGRFINFTKLSDSELLKLVAKVKFDPFLYWLKSKRKYLRYFKFLLIKLFMMHVRPLLSEKTYDFLKKSYKKIA